MKTENKDKLIESGVSRRTIVRTGAKLAYAAPLVAASFRLGSDQSAAQVASAMCEGQDCFSPITCGGSTSCACREIGGVSFCLQDVFCSSAPNCSTSSDCGAGSICVPSMQNCCSGDNGKCLRPCGVFAFDTSGPVLLTSDKPEGTSSALGLLAAEPTLSI